MHILLTTDNKNLSSSRIIQFLKITKMFNSDVMKVSIHNSVNRKLNVNTATFYYAFSDTFTNFHSALEYIERWFGLVVEEKKHLDLMFEQFEKVLYSSNLNISSEVEIFNAADGWINHDADQRCKFAKELIKKVRLHLLSSAALNNLLSNENWFSKSSHSKIYIENVMNRKTGFDYERIDHQNRYCGHSQFDMLISHDANKFHDIYKFEQNKLNRTVKVACRNKCFNVCSVVSINENIYFLGKSSFYSYSLIKKQWTDEMHFPENHILYCACSLMDTIYFLGGHSQFQTRAIKQVIYCTAFNTKLGNWKRITGMTGERNSATCVVYGVNSDFRWI